LVDPLVHLLVLEERQRLDVLVEVNRRNELFELRAVDLKDVAVRDEAPKDAVKEGAQDRGSVDRETHFEVGRGRP
jgi:hypothetical protein